ncbi:hypothetical protein QZH41_017158 [Actinostola sp. cb2023]|nr:hypothetical protein QZH41_017158 [Actinostola sp. cb2023]
MESFVMRARRKVRNTPVLLLAMVLTSFFHAGHSVWPMNLPHQVFILGVQPIMCSNLDGLTKAQILICQENAEQMTSVGLGAKVAIAECQFQFQYRRWNCSIPERDKGSLFERITKQDTREAALTYAISSAGVVWALARACAEGNLSSCSCSRERRPKDLKKDFQWGGCGDNFEYGEKFSKKFMDAGEKDYTAKADTSSMRMERYARTLMNYHNNDVGRLITMEMSLIECKCHGVSGSCSLKTCWRQLSEFREIGNRLHDKYDAAILVALRRLNGKSTLLPKKIKRSYSKRQALAHPTKSDLVYLKLSPNFCYANPKLGALGTQGRKCIKDAPGTDGCDLLCCDKGFVSKIETVKKRCRCKFYWCCTVRCKVCSKNVTIHTCK